jgi:hypothetical protein
MKKSIPKTILAGLLGVVINAPFAIGEFLTGGSGPRSDFPPALFIMLWVVVTLAAYLALSLIETFKKKTAHSKPFLTVLQVLILSFFVWVWVTLIVDQWPCFFLGMSGC